MHLINRLNNFVIIGSNLVISQTSSTSTNSVKNITSFTELPKGQYFNNPSTSLNYIYLKDFFFFRIKKLRIINYRKC